MSTEVMQIDVNNYSAMATAMGMNIDSGGDKKANMLARLKIQHSPIMGEKIVDGAAMKVEVVNGGTYRLDVPSNGVLYSRGVTIRPFAQRFMYKRFHSNHGAKPGEPMGTYQKTIMSNDMNIDMKDNMGTFNCGKPAGYIQDYNALSQDKKDLIKQIKRVRVIFGTISMEDARYESGESGECSNIPFIWEIDNRDAFKIMGEPFSKLGKMQRLPVQHNISLATEERKIPTGAVFYLPIPTLDAKNEIKLQEEDQDLFADFMAWVQNYNDYICSEWDKTTRNKMADDEVETVESFIDIEGSDD